MKVDECGLEGLTHLAALAIYYLLKVTQLSLLGPAGTSALFVLPSLPWFLKPFLAFLSDTTPIFGMRRKPYLIVFSLVETIGYLLLAEYPDNVWTVSAGLVTIALGAAFCSAISEVSTRYSHKGFIVSVQGSGGRNECLEHCFA
eukprot:Gregarina_sp_Poly_1__1415@NODE_1351_length_4314_cov_50_333176_g1_i1_p4_GENE_NODE_1351_length_4314_cov_50_333176_g1_i1NODE_1351_length_4314_cov_50_333176_g1_i1_p4_ORF_typecomplete_len144_score8_17BT1/PF03092_16/3_4e20PUCC/PF03209_15/1_1e05MFS_2/PF13347_6/0_013MFS_1/PF07690_16/0_025DUF2070/PF09843_9/0_74ABC2_membrane_3/PF12698_7/0_11ABC2_membrane_3/PF12698_7/6_7e02_NODE_1351_length_4314_cov_50_333176_g1_i125793010